MVRFKKAALEIRRSPTKAAGCVFALKSAADRPPDFDPTGKSVGVVISCLAPLEKIFLFAPEANQFTDSRCLVPRRGDRASSRARGGMRWTRERQAMSGDGRAGS